MRIRIPPSRRKRRRLILNLASMIDVIFLLLIYFMVTTIVTAPEDRLSSTIQTNENPEAGARSDFQPQIIEVGVIDGRPAYRLGARLFHDDDALRDALESLDLSSGLFIKVGDDVNVGFLMAAFQAGHDAGFSNVTYVVRD